MGDDGSNGLGAPKSQRPVDRLTVTGNPQGGTFVVAPAGPGGFRLGPGSAMPCLGALVTDKLCAICLLKDGAMVAVYTLKGL